MRSTSVIILATTMFFSCGPSAPTPERTSQVPVQTPDVNSSPPKASGTSEIQAEVGKLEGKWIGMSFHIDGFASPVAKWYRYTFDGDRMTTETDESEPATVKFYLDPHAEPKQLDTSIMVDGAEQISKGIYSIDGDVLQLSWRVIGDRPADFQSRELDEKVVLVLHRSKD